jgi:hypothetical protein
MRSAAERILLSGRFAGDEYATRVTSHFASGGGFVDEIPKSDSSV